ncbi:hypothetical protein AB4Y85_18115 [Microvirga sp. 2YAF29]|uniref:hypothetical protein n=1 Tax=Microvirga sp. 2YAF29 TaxID=3233031 RepID=UPI003F965F2D
MTKRILIGSDGTGRFRIRASAAGHNVDNAALDDLLFDADAVPGRIIRQGARYCAWNEYQQSQPQVPAETTFAHNVPPGLSFIIVAIAKARYVDGSEPEDWRYWANEGSPGHLRVVLRNFGNSDMKGHYVTPHRFSGDDSNGYVYWGGWSIGWNGTNITVTNNCACGLWVRWQALEL